MGSKNVIFNPDLEVVGHRGHVSRYPENTVEGFLSAVSIGVDALEMDLVVSADKEVVISHEPFMAARIVRSPEGKRISRAKQKDYNLYQMTYDSIKSFSVGEIKRDKFSKQRRIPAYKPLLSEIFEKIEGYRKEKDLDPVVYYLEVKSEPQDYGVYQPYPEELADLIMKIVKTHELQDAVIVKSFDAEFLNTLKKYHPEVKTSFLIYKTPWQEKLRNLDFKPEVISPHYRQLRNKEQVEELQALGYKVIPWTVNSKRRIRKMINLGVDGIISDYPERVLARNKREAD